MSTTFERWRIDSAKCSIEEGIITLQDMLKQAEGDNSHIAKEIYEAIGEAGAAYSRLNTLLESMKEDSR